MTALAFILIFGTIVFFHELGHFMVAKAAGVRVYEFALGFPPRIVRAKLGNTQYSVGLIPLGGFVKLAGMDPPPEGMEQERVLPEEDFNTRPVPVRMAIIAAGPLMNFLLAALIFAYYMSFMAAWPPLVTGVVRGSPAFEAGLQPGDRLIALAGEEIRRPGQVVELIQRNPGKPIEVVVQRGGRRRTLQVVPEISDEGVGRLGITLEERQGFLAAVQKGFVRTYQLSYGFILAIGSMILGKIEPDIAGPLGIYQLVGETAQQGLVSLLFLAVVLNINLGLLNFLPIPVLDGGWLLFLTLEGIRGKPLKPEQQGLAQFIGLALLILLMLFATLKDLARLGSA